MAKENPRKIPVWEKSAKVSQLLLVEQFHYRWHFEIYSFFDKINAVKPLKILIHLSNLALSNPFPSNHILLESLSAFSHLKKLFVKALQTF
jgi:hypothetical protein